MNVVPCFKFNKSARRLAVRLAQVAILALFVAGSIPARALDEREIKSRVAPVYPEIAKRMKITGAVMVEAVVGPDGKVSDAKALSGNHSLTAAAEDAVRKWRFAPGAGKATVQVEITFALAQ